MTIEDLRLGHPLFADSLKTADAVLTTLVNKMNKKGVTEGDLTLKIRLTVEEKQIVDQDTGALVTAMVPEVKYKAGYSIKEGDSIDGKVAASDETVLVKDPALGIWRIGTQSGQESLFDEEL